MNLFAIGDLHLALEGDKPMDIFGPKWEDHVGQISRNWKKVVSDDDIVVILGDVSWAMSLPEAACDLAFIDDLPGSKLIIKGNHDYWWSTASKMNTFFDQMGFETLSILHNDAVVFEGIGICGTRGWVIETGEEPGEHDKKIFARELLRLEASLMAAKNKGAEELMAFLHYPPRLRSMEKSPIADLLEKYGVSRCYYGHLHGKGHNGAVEGMVDGIFYSLVSGDYIGFTPRLVCSLD